MNKIEKDLVSIITPCYNSEKYISKTIVSVIKQTYKKWEISLKKKQEVWMEHKMNAVYI